MADLPPAVLTTKEAARYLGLHPITLYRKAQRLEIPWVRLGDRKKGFSRTDLDLWIKSKTVRTSHDALKLMDGRRKENRDA